MSLESPLTPDFIASSTAATSAPRLLRDCRIALPVTALLLVGTFAPTAAAQQGRTPFSDYQGRRGLSPYTALGFQGDNPNTGGSLGALQNIIRPQQLQAAQVRQQRV
jgi:hypothetical protein